MAVSSVAASLIAHLQLEPHPEGGFYRRSYESRLQLLDPAALQSSDSVFTVFPRPFSTAIYFLLPDGCQSYLHRIPSDEMWHFYQGGPLCIVEIDPESWHSRETILGPDVLKGQLLQHVVRGGMIFGAYPCAGTDFALVGCTVAPGFAFGDFTLFTRADLLARCPTEVHPIVARLTPPP
jgi:predicted cupin superfamily sugar epimerase